MLDTFFCFRPQPHGPHGDDEHLFLVRRAVLPGGSIVGHSYTSATRDAILQDGRTLSQGTAPVLALLRTWSPHHLPQGNVAKRHN